MKTVNIHGNEYITVAGRLELAHKDGKLVSIETELLPVDGQVVVKATVKTKTGVFTGISAANPAKLIEKTSPFEVAETSAVGRALGFAGYGVLDGIATAEEMKKAEVTNGKVKKGAVDETVCTECGTKEVPLSVIKFSNDSWGKTICYKCQSETGLSKKQAVNY